MYSYPTRSERRYVRLHELAENGKVSAEKFVLYPREIEKLEKEGFKIYSVTPYKKTKDLFEVTIDWSNAYGRSIPYMVNCYIIGIINSYPENFVDNVAQKLFIISNRKINKLPTP